MDGKGVLGFPMRLTMALVLVALCVPVLSDMADDFQDSADGSIAGGEVDRIVTAAGKAYNGGPGTSIFIDVSVVAGYEIVIGGNEADAYSVTVTDGANIVEKTYTEHPSVRFLGDSVTITGNCTICLTCVNADEGYGVEVACA